MEREAKKMTEKNEKNNEAMEQAFMLAFEKHRDLCAKISREIQYLRLHENMLTYSGPEGDFNVISAEYKDTCTYLDIVKEAAAIGRRICFLNQIDFNNETSVGSFFRDGFELIQLFGDLYVLSAGKKKMSAAAAQ